MKLLAGKVAIVTGAARGIGAAIALKLAEQGAHIAFTYVSDSSAEKANQLVAEIEKLGVKAKAWKSNAGDYQQAESFVNDVVKEFGTVDICVNNAGISKDNLLLRLTPEQWDEVMEVNLKSVYNMTKQVIRPMMKARKGSIVNMSSIIGIRGNAGQSSYAASKAGIIGFTKSMEQELGSRNIRVNAIAPGGTVSGLTAWLVTGSSDNLTDANTKIGVSNPMRRAGQPADIANAALFLASDEASYVNGHVLVVDGAGEVIGDRNHRFVQLGSQIVQETGRIGL